MTTTDRTCVFLDRRAQKRCTECASTLDLCVCPAVDEQAARRIGSSEGLFLKRVRDELTLADERGDTNRYLLNRLTHAVGKLNDQVLSHHLGQGASAQDIMHTLIQAGVLVTRLAVDGDGDFSYEPATIFGEDSPTR